MIAPPSLPSRSPLRTRSGRALWPSYANTGVFRGIFAVRSNSVVPRPWREPVAKRAARRALHQGLIARQADLTAASRDDIEIGGADQQRAELRLIQRAKEVCETAIRDV